MTPKSPKNVQIDPKLQILKKKYFSKSDGYNTLFGYNKVQWFHSAMVTQCSKLKILKNV